MTDLHAGGQLLRSTRARLIARHGAVCGRCRGSIDLTLSGLHPLGLTVGHIIPLSRGGTDADDNLQPEHRRCNLVGGARLTPPRATIARPIPEV